MKKPKFYSLIAGVAMMLLLTQCLYEEIPEPVIEIPDVVSFSEDIQPIFDAKCVNCHGGSRSPDLSVGNAYNSLINGGYIEVNNPAQSILLTSLNQTQHGVATDADKALILEWITEGADNN